MNSILKTTDKTFEIHVCSKPFFFSQEQIILLSPSAFIFITQTHQPFQINGDEFILSHNLIDSFSQLSSLLENNKEIVINESNKLIFQYLSKIRQNNSLKSIYEKGSF
jgi:hypothetical protein